MLLECGVLSLSSFLLAEIIFNSRLSKLKIFLSFQNIKNASINIKRVADKIGKRETSGIVINFGNKTFNLHHSIFGWILAGTSVALANLSLLSVSLGLIIHHIIREKKIF
ncbi:MAG: hypothetical protein QMD12_01520 [Candidatus Aenigmarchaeota archaeon]|nr:hypothetical protein [Candidatus Aenigmarchaeota archaeon]